MAGIVQDIGDNKIILQGIADCVFVEDGKAYIVDYKTDNVKDFAQLVFRYEPQIDLYKKIISTVLKEPIGKEYFILLSFLTG